MDGKYEYTLGLNELNPFVWIILLINFLLSSLCFVFMKSSLFIEKMLSKIDGIPIKFVENETTDKK